MTRQQRADLIAALRMIALVNPARWGLLIAAADELKRPEAELDKVRNEK